MAKTKLISKERLIDELGLPYEAIEDEIVDQSRWETYHTIVFLDPEDNKYYQADYSEGSTEQQDIQMWEHEDEIECTEVKPVEVTVTKYVPVE